MSRSQSPDEVGPQRILVPWILFVLTVVSVFVTGMSAQGSGVARWFSGWTFAVPLLAILMAHEAGHYVASRIHRVPASLPYFIPFPLFSPFGTMGAVILMRGRIRSARALLDIGAAGPLAGMLVAIPVMILGLSLSPVEPRSTSNYIQEGQSLLYWLLKRVVLGPIPETHDVMLHPTAFAAWAGFFVTFLNLLPFGQLDGGHVAYALFNRRHDAWSRRMVWVPALLILYNGWEHARGLLIQAYRGGFSSVSEGQITQSITSTMLWLVLLVLIVVMRNRAGAEHPPVDEPGLSPGRRVIGYVTLGLFLLLFMPSPLVQH